MNLKWARMLAGGTWGDGTQSDGRFTGRISKKITHFRTSSNRNKWKLWNRKFLLWDEGIWEDSEAKRFSNLICSVLSGDSVPNRMQPGRILEKNFKIFRSNGSISLSSFSHLLFNHSDWKMELRLISVAISVWDLNAISSATSREMSIQFPMPSIWVSSAITAANKTAGFSNCWTFLVRTSYTALYLILATNGSCSWRL